MKITYTDVKPAVEAVKQAGRIMAVAVIPLVISQLQENRVDFRSIAIAGVIALLMAIDKFLHLEGKIEGNEELTKGLTRF